MSIVSSHKKTNVGLEAQLSVLERLVESTKPNNNVKNLVQHAGAEPPIEKICGSVCFLKEFGLPANLLAKVSKRAIENGTTAAEELIAYAGMKEITYFKFLAKHLGVLFVEAADIEEVFIRRREPLAALHPHNTVWARTTDSVFRNIVAPPPRMVEQLETMVAKSTSNDTIAITSPSILKSIIIKELEPELTENAVKYLANSDPLSSARFGADAWQGALFLALIILTIVFSSLNPSATALGVHLVVSSFFISSMTLRLFAASTFRGRKLAALKTTSDAEKPTYSVMIALLDEADVVPDLVKSMKALRWPRAKLEIKFICEANDTSTLLALEAEDLDPRFEIIKVPDGEPRTKPKALCYALGFTTGKYITIYDAEDRPHPKQLLEAYAALESGNEKLACVQAPLITANARNNFLTALFYFEYAALFGGLLPWLARNNSPIMLGGTSNHFSRAALLDIGAWDPHNVTEDADLGLRIWRKGYRTDMITHPTFEDAPTNFKTWLPQRTRWFKGWMQTWLVQMRRPLALKKNMSLTAFIITQVLLTGTIVSALLHPIVLAKAIWLSILIFMSGADNIWITWLAIIDWLTVLLSYIGFAVLCWRSTHFQTRRKLAAKLLLTPFYWTAISVAAWRGLYQLIRNPFYWEKTPHSPHEKATSVPLN